MAKKSIEQRLAELDARRSALKARLDKQERANDTRRKVLLGAFLLHHVEQTGAISPGGPYAPHILRKWLKQELPSFLTRDSDKELLDDLLKPEPARQEPPTPEATSLV